MDSRIRDASVAVLVAAAAVAVGARTDVAAIDPRLREPDVLSMAVTGAAGLAAYWWIRRPLWFVAALTVAGTVVAATSHFVGLLPWLLALAIGIAAAVEPWRLSVAAVVVAWAAYTAMTIAGIPDNEGDSYASTSVLLAAAWAIGTTVRLHRERVAAELTAARQQAATAVAEERLRIARELHDVVAHSMSLIAVHAGVGAHLIRSRPDKAEQALEVIADTSRDALAQTRSILGVLRSTEPVVTELDALVDSVRLSGLEVEVTADGDPLALPLATRLAVYRIVQESLTNVVKHARAGRAIVRLDYGGVSIEILDDGRGPVSHVAGHGLTGLRERAALLGGSLTAGPGAQGGFRVLAELPAA